jgi:hypothetical protein
MNTLLELLCDCSILITCYVVALLLVYVYCFKNLKEAYKDLINKIRR